jgi:cell division protein FtsB
MRWLITVLIIVLVLLQWRLWFGEGSISHKLDLDRQLATQRAQNQALKTRNLLIAKEVESLKTNSDSIVEKARQNLGMTKKNETFYLVIDNKQLPAAQAAPVSDE